MTVSEAIGQLQELVLAGHGDKPLVMVNDSLIDLPITSFAVAEWDPGVVAVEGG